jgi:iron-sulfur cluster repair protein YtfE (RIC family)
MAIETLAEALQREHREIDGGLARVAAGLPDGELRLEPLSRVVTGLRRHIYLEEEFLFPPLRAAGMVMPVFVMVREHGEMWKALDALEAELGARKDLASLAGLCRELGTLEDAHNPKEEQILYPQADGVLTATANTGLRTLLETGRMPHGWVCEAARR